MATKTITYSGNVSRGGESSVDIVTINDVSRWIRIKFRDRGGNTATYEYQRSSMERVKYDVMLQLAKFGRGLNGYIHRNRIKGKKL